jgi:hypothetical protein
MTPDEAIKILEVEERGLDPKYHPRLTKALKLGIEALKRIKADRILPYPIVSDLLPGETEE